MTQGFIFLYDNIYISRRIYTSLWQHLYFSMTQGFIPPRLSETAQTYLCQDKRRKISLQRKEKEKSSLIDKKIYASHTDVSVVQIFRVDCQINLSRSILRDSLVVEWFSTGLSSTIAHFLQLSDTEGHIRNNVGVIGERMALRGAHTRNTL